LAVPPIPVTENVTDNRKGVKSMNPSNMVYIPLSEETVALLEQLRKKQENWDSFIKRFFQNQLWEQDWNKIQKEKMKELWDNEYDEIWNSL
jgi:hypothetical protein